MIPSKGLKAFPETPDKYLLLLYPKVGIIRERAAVLSEMGIIVPKYSVQSGRPADARSAQH